MFSIEFYNNDGVTTHIEPYATAGALEQAMAGLIAAGETNFEANIPQDAPDVDALVGRLKKLFELHILRDSPPGSECVWESVFSDKV